jgi:hypothetical protein
MFSNKRVDVFFLMSSTTSRSRTSSIRRLAGAPFERSHFAINPDRHQPVPSILVYRHPHTVEM